MSTRIGRLKKVLRDHDLDALIVSSLPHVRYLTGFSGSHGLCVIGKGAATLVTDSRFALQSREEAPGCRRIVTSLGLMETLAVRGLLGGVRRAGFEEDSLTQGEYRELKRSFPRVRFLAASRLTDDLALVKDAAEIACIRRAARISDRVFREILPRIRPGVREREIAAEIGYLQKLHGGEREAFEPIVVAGPRGALPHALPSGRRVRSGEFLTLDFGCTVHGYHSDLTRTVAVGKGAPRLQAAYGAVLAAQLAAIDAARAGMWAKDLDAVSRDLLTKAGFGRYFTHALGHGLGLRIHERPRVSPLSKERLQQGSVITIEPGVYIPGLCGIRIEDDVLITGNGCRVLTKASKAFMIL